jgi:hypothetical protein
MGELFPCIAHLIVLKVRPVRIYSGTGESHRASRCFTSSELCPRSETRFVVFYFTVTLFPYHSSSTICFTSNDFACVCMHLWKSTLDRENGRLAQNGDKGICFWDFESRCHLEHQRVTDLMSDQNKQEWYGRL